MFNKYIFAECLLNWNFGDAIAVQDLRGINVWNFVWCFFPPNQNPGAAPEHIYNLVDVQSNSKSRLKSKYRNYNVCKKVNYTKDKAS